MRACLLTLAAILLVLLLPLQPAFAVIDSSPDYDMRGNLDLPEALADDDSFDDLPFEQLRQALREEVEHGGPNKNSSQRSFKQYNLLLR